MRFSDALERLFDGERVYREGWNGKGMYLVVQKGTTISSLDARGGVAKQIANERPGHDIVIHPHIDMRDVNGEVVIGWIPSQTDIFANDWVMD